MSVKAVVQRVDLFIVLQSMIKGQIDYYNSPEVTSTCSQHARVVGRKEGYEHVLKMIDELLQVEVFEVKT